MTVQITDGGILRMDHQGNVIGSDGEKGKISRVRRSWSRAEEDALIRCLSDIVNDGWKTENDFKES
ncbi:hypothetical protein ACS0TY_014625 [Phlomoides rotata]